MNTSWVELWIKSDDRPLYVLLSELHLRIIEGILDLPCDRRTGSVRLATPWGSTFLILREELIGCTVSTPEGRKSAWDLQKLLDSERGQPDDDYVEPGDEWKGGR